MKPLAVASVLAITLTSACASTDDNLVTGPFAVAMTNTTAPIYDDGQMQLYQVSIPVQLPVLRGRAEGAAAPYPRAPFVRKEDVRYTLRFVLTNLDDAPHSVELLIDPWNEFVRYQPGLSLGAEEEAVPNLSGIDRYYVLQPKQRLEGLLPPDDFFELATDLATAQSIFARPPDAEGDFGGATLYNRAFNIQNRSTQPDPLLGGYIPQVIAGVTGFDLGLRTSQPANVAVEVIVDVVDVHGERIIPPDSSERPAPPPGTILTPPGGLAQ